MPPVHPATTNYDVIVIGGGSGGLGFGRRASAMYGQKVAIIERSGRLGGTCVNVGCVPKKIMWNAADVAEHLREAPGYGFSIPGGEPSFDWTTLKKKRDAYIKRLNAIYDRNIEKDHCDYLSANATFVGPNQVKVDYIDGSGSQTITGKHICIAVGGQPKFPTEIPGAQLGIDSDGFFQLEKQPKRVAIVGAGYIAIEFAGIFNALGSETHLFVRRDTFLRTFDPMIQEVLMAEYKKRGIKIHTMFKTVKEGIEKQKDGALKFYYDDVDGPGGSVEVDSLIWAIGRTALTKDLDLDKVGVKMNPNGNIVVDDYQNTSNQGIYAIGDVTGNCELTPVAIAAGRRLADRLFGGPKFSATKLSYENIPTVIFAHPEIGAIGLTEPQARKKYGDENIKIYKSSFVAMYYAMLDTKGPTSYKLICEGPNERIVGMHIIGIGSAEILQGFGVAIKMGATKADFDSCVAIHPTSAEELVTMR